jgi:hypothetical protein
MPSLRDRVHIQCQVIGACSGNQSPTLALTDEDRPPLSASSLQAVPVLNLLVLFPPRESLVRVGAASSQPASRNSADRQGQPSQCRHLLDGRDHSARDRSTWVVVWELL